MKKSVIWVLIIVLAFSSGMAFAENFDYTIFENFDGYEYDEFEEVWMCQEEDILKEYNDATISLAISVFGKTDIPPMPPLFSVFIAHNKEAVDYAIEIKMKIDGVIYSKRVTPKVVSQQGSSVFLTIDDLDFVEALSSASGDIAIKILIESGTLTYDVSSEDCESIKNLCSFLVEIDYWKYALDMNS